MRRFRQSLDLSQTSVRLSNEHDLASVARLFRDGRQRYYGLLGSDLPVLLAAAHAIVIEAQSSLWGVALVGWRADRAIWLRGVALSNGLDVPSGLTMLLPPLHAEMRARGIQHLFYAGDEASELWLNPQLRLYGYVPNTEVVVYEKRKLDIPSWGNQEVIVRAARISDLEAIVALDQSCFEPQWTKDDLALHTAITQGPLCIVAALDEQIVGYAYATSHFGDRLTHLVRIAVLPEWQGHGIGVRLLAEVIAFARLRGATLVTLNTQLYNVQSQRLYRWFGFHKTGERQVVLRYDL